MGQVKGEKYDIAILPWGATGRKHYVGGNIDIEGVWKYSNLEEVRENVNQHIDKLAKGGGYIVSSSHNLHQYVPVENFYAMRDAAHKYKIKLN